MKVLNLKAGKDAGGKVVYKFSEEGSLYQGKDEINTEKTNFDGSLANFVKVHPYQNTVCFTTLTEKKGVADGQITIRPKLLLKIVSVLDKSNHLHDYPV